MSASMYWILFLLLASLQTFPRKQQVMLDMGVREQWEENFGYCGEVSFISAGLYYGEYVSQYDMRHLATPGVNEGDVKSQLFLGVNDFFAAQQLKLKSEVWNGDGPQPFLAWVKRQLIEGHPVAMALYMNMSAFHEQRSGDSDYDHIVPVLGFLSNFNDGAYHDDDVLIFSDNGLYTGNGQPFRFAVRFSDLINDRIAANLESSPVYSVPMGNQYGIAFTGVIGDTVPISLTTERRYERPDIKDGSDDRPAPMAERMTVHASNLDPSMAYYLYRYNKLLSVPDHSFNENAALATDKWLIIRGTTSFDLEIDTNSSVTSVFRLVPVNAP